MRTWIVKENAPIMDPVQPFDDCVSTSTPDLQSFVSRIPRRFFISHEQESDLSPIRKTSPSVHNSSINLNTSSSSSTNEFKKDDRRFIKTNRKLSFSEDGLHDSGFQSSSNLSLIENHTKHTDFPTDENCNITDDLIFDKNFNFQPVKYIFTDNSYYSCNNTKSEYRFSENLDNQNSFFNINSKNTIKIDFLSQLNSRNCTAVLSSILSYLDGEDLRRVKNTSTEWKEIIFSDTKANERLQFYIIQKKEISEGAQKENKFATRRVVDQNRKSQFLSVINSQREVKQPLKHTSVIGLFESFINMRNLGEKKLKKCPKCQYASKVYSSKSFCCTRDLCKHTFCKDCFGPYNENHLCSMTQLNETLPSVVGSKQSKMNLKRL